MVDRTTVVGTVNEGVDEERTNLILLLAISTDLGLVAGGVV
jgi:hypothetical protein